MGGTTNRKTELMPCPIFRPVSPANMKRAETATPIKLLTIKMMRNKKTRIPVECLRFSMNKLSFMAFDFAAKIRFLYFCSRFNNE